ncbi:type VII secretion system-associated protein [Streptomyces parvulus]|uniref:type VII secretion system-associated protein n=1 Tax=Streptomyces parvulus TaxID=146923 RepID=UPI003443131B
MADFSQLDKTSIQSFVDNDLATFITDLKKVLEEDPSMLSISDNLTTPETVGVTSAGKPLVMGMADDDDLVSGSSFTDSLASNIETVVATLKAQQDTFDEINDGLRQTLEELFKTQGDNLGSIEADAFTDVLSDAGFSGETPIPEPDDSTGDDEDSVEGSDEDSEAADEDSDT